MRKTVIVIAAVAVGIVGGVITLSSCKRVGQGEVGVVWTMKNGVQDEVLTPGLHFESPWTKVKTYPVSQQQLILSNNPSDYGKKEHDDWHVDAPADGGMVKLNMTVNYNFIADRVTQLYTKFNGMDGDSIVDSMVQNSIIAYIKEVTPEYTVMDIYSDKRAEVSKSITEYLNNRLTEEYGINVASALIIDVQLDDTLQAKIQAELDRKTAAAQAEVSKVNAEADAEVQKIKAEAEAEKTRIAAQAEADANTMINNSITEDLIRMKEAEARLKHGWVTVQGAQAVVTDK